MKTYMVPIIKNKTEDTSNKNKYRQIALFTAASKLFEIWFDDVLKTYLVKHDQQFRLSLNILPTSALSLLKACPNIIQFKVPLYTHV